MREKNTPQRSLPPGVATWDRLARQSRISRSRSATRFVNGGLQRLPEEVHGWFRPLLIAQHHAFEVRRQQLRTREAAANMINPRKRGQESTDDNEQPQNQAQLGEVRRRQARAQLSINSTSTLDGSVEGVTRERPLREVGSDDLDLTDLQKHMLRIIDESGGSVSHEDMVQEVEEMWPTLRKRDGSRYAYDSSRVVTATLANTSSSAPLFERDLSRENCWGFGARTKEIDIAGYIAEARSMKEAFKANRLGPIASGNDEVRIVKRRRSGGPDEASGVSISSTNGARSRQLSVPSVSSGNNLGQDKKVVRTSHDGDGSVQELTTLQDMLMRIVLSFNGVTTFENIYNEVLKDEWRHVHQWGADCKRALLASLSHNPPGTFKKTRSGSWTIAPKAMNVAQRAVDRDPARYGLSLRDESELV